MKKPFMLCLIIVVVVSSILKLSEVNVMAQAPPPTPTPEPTIAFGEVIKGPAEGILELGIRDGLKRVLLADLFAVHGYSEQALEIVDYTRPVTVLGRELAVEEDPELIRLFEYQRQKIKRMERPLPTPIPTPPETVKSRAEAAYQNILYLKKHKKPEEAIQSALIALELYQQIESIAGQLLVRYQLALLYEELGDKTEAVHQAQEFIKLEQQLELVKKHEKMQELLKE